MVEILFNKITKTTEKIGTDNISDSAGIWDAGAPDRTCTFWLVPNLYDMSEHWS